MLHASDNPSLVQDSCYGILERGEQEILGEIDGCNPHSSQYVRPSSGLLGISPTALRDRIALDVNAAAFELQVYSPLDLNLTPSIRLSQGLRA